MTKLRFDKLAAQTRMLRNGSEYVFEDREPAPIPTPSDDAEAIGDSERNEFVRCRHCDVKVRRVKLEKHVRNVHSPEAQKSAAARQQARAQRSANNRSNRAARSKSNLRSRAEATRVDREMRSEVTFEEFAAEIAGLVPKLIVAIAYAHGLPTSGRVAPSFQRAVRDRFLSLMHNPGRPPR